MTHKKKKGCSSARFSLVDAAMADDRRLSGVREAQLLRRSGRFLGRGVRYFMAPCATASSCMVRLETLGQGPGKPYPTKTPAFFNKMQA
jgi:hypothetical protein